MSRRAFTLLELLLVLALIVAIGALVTPFVSRGLQNQRLRYAADQLRAEWSHARSTAMKTGRLQMFRYRPETSQYRLEAWVAENDELESSADADETLAAAPSTSAVEAGLDAQGEPLDPGARELPGEAAFVDSEIFDDSRAAEIETEAPSGPTTTSGAAGWSRPILFYPDGTTSAARVVVKNDNYYILLNLRGLTGSAVASDLLSLEEVSHATQQ